MNLKGSFKGFTLFYKAIKSTKDESLASLEVLFALTFVFSLALYFVEHAAQPEVFSNFWDSFLWSCMSYLGNPGKFAPGDPITLVGRILWIFIALFKLLLFAVPTSIVTIGFRNELSKAKTEKKNHKNAEKIRNSMYVHCSLLKSIRFWPKKFYRFNEIKMNLDLSESEIIDAVRSAPDLRLRDLSIYLSGTHGVKPEMLAVEMCHSNTDYGFCSRYEDAFDKFPETKSNVTIICPVATTEAGLSYFAYQLARIGRFNLVINDKLSSNADSESNRCIIKGIYDYQYNNAKAYPKLHKYVDDIQELVKGDDSFAVIITSASTPKSECVHQKILMNVNVAAESESNTLADCTTVSDTSALQSFYDDFCSVMKSGHGIEPNAVYMSYKKTRVQNYIRNKFGSNVIELAIADDYRVFGLDVKAQYGSIKTLAEAIHRHFETVNTDWDTSKWTSDDAKKYRSSRIPHHKGEPEDNDSK